MLLLLGVCFVALGGCAARHPDGSFVSDDPDMPFFISIAREATELIAQTYPPGHSTLFVRQADKRDFFYVVFERQLRAKGFAMPSVQTIEAITVTYTIDRLLDPDSGELNAFYLQLKLASPAGEVHSLARPYTRTADRLGCLTATTWEGKSPRFPKVEGGGESKGFITTAMPPDPRPSLFSKKGGTSGPSGKSGYAESSDHFDDSQPWR